MKDVNIVHPINRAQVKSLTIIVYVLKIIMYQIFVDHR